MRSAGRENADNPGPTFHAMSVIPVTVFFSLLLVGFFVVLFLREQRRPFASAERDSLLPLADETARLAAPRRARNAVSTDSRH
jgi:cbb3-type cytochrome oxidase subunit 3